MTNGEMIQSMFPNMNFGTLAQDDVIVNRGYSSNDEPQVFIPKRVWDSKYKEPVKEQESVLDKIRAEIEKQEKWLLQAGYTAYNVDIAFDAVKAAITESEDAE